MKNLAKYIIVLSGILLLVGCHDGIFYTRFKSVDSNGWKKKSGVAFELPEVEDSSAYDVRFGVRVWANYEFRNIRLIARLYEDKKVISVDTISYDLFDKSDNSKCRGIAMLESFESLDHKYVLKPKHKYKVKVYHHMLLDPLERVSDVGITLQHSPLSSFALSR